MLFTLDEIARATGGAYDVAPADGRMQATGLAWDSRAIGAGDVYLALPGERVDGHAFAAAALEAGAVCVLASRSLSDDAVALAQQRGAAVVRVTDPYDAVTALAREWRGRLQGRVIGITGSTGKTTTKNLVRDVLAAHGTVVATEGNQNNELGVPKTLLNASADTQYVVVEMGMRGLGQLERLCAFVRPEWGLVTNVGDSHIELLGSRENIARAKSELIAALPKDAGVAFLNDADDMTDALWGFSGLEGGGAVRVRFDGSGACGLQDASANGAPQAPAVWAENVALNEEGCPSFTLCACGFAAGLAPCEGPSEVQRVPCALALRGLHNVSNACSAAAVGLAAGMTLAQCASALATARPAAGRQEVLASKAGFTVVNDAYNANPDSMRASLSTFCALQAAGRRIAVLGDMGELGDFAPQLHREVGSFAAAQGLDALICVGELSRNIASAAEEAGMDAMCIACVADASEALRFVRSFTRPGDAVLVKASHFMQLERVVEGLVE